MNGGPEALEADEGLTLDSISSVRLLQRRRGYRFNLDPILLANFCGEEGIGAPVLDLGTGSGIIGLLLATRYGAPSVVGLELQPLLFELAARNIRLNGCERRMSLVLGDLRELSKAFRPQSFEAVVCNPPYLPIRQGVVSPDPERAIARHEVLCGIADVARAAATVLTRGGTLSLVYPAVRLAELTQTLSQHGIASTVAQFVHSRHDRPAKLVLLRGVLGGNAALTVRPPLVLHEDGEQTFSAPVRAMLEGGGAVMVPAR